MGFLSGERARGDLYGKAWGPVCLRLYLEGGRKSYSQGFICKGNWKGFLLDYSDLLSLRHLKGPGKGSFLLRDTKSFHNKTSLSFFSESSSDIFSQFAPHYLVSLACEVRQGSSAKIKNRRSR